MPIFVNCDCGKRLQGRDQDAGKQTRCPYCNRIITLPGSSDPAPVTAPPPPVPPPPAPTPAARPAAVTEYTCHVCHGSFRGGEVYNEEGRYICKRCFDREVPEEEPERERPSREDRWGDRDRPVRSRSVRRRNDEDDIIRPNAGGYVNNYLTESILVTIFCCLPFGIVAIVHAANVNSCLARGDYNGAVYASNTAKTWCGISFGIGLGGIVLWFLVVISAGGGRFL